MKSSPHENKPSKEDLDKWLKELDLADPAYQAPSRFLIARLLAKRRVKREAFESEQADFLKAFGGLVKQLQKLQMKPDHQVVHASTLGMGSKDLWVASMPLDTATKQGANQQLRIIINEIKTINSGNTETTFIQSWDYALDMSKAHFKSRSRSMEIPTIDDTGIPTIGMPPRIGASSSSGLHMESHPDYRTPIPVEPSRDNWDLRQLCDQTAQVTALTGCLSMLDNERTLVYAQRLEVPLQNDQ